MSIFDAIPSQYELIQKLYEYARLNERSNVEDISLKGGYCSGLSNLVTYYYSIGKLDEYFNFLRKFNAWDGSAAQLDAAFSKEIDHFINDLEFMHTPMQVIPNMGQRDLKKILDVIGSKKFHEKRVVDNLLHLEYVCSKNQLVKLLDEVNEKSSLEGKVIDFSGHDHSVCVFYQEDKYCIYDPNKKKVVQIESTVKLVDLLADFLLTPGELIPLTMNINHIRNKEAPKEDLSDLKTLKHMQNSVDGLLRNVKIQNSGSYNAFGLAVRNKDLSSLRQLIHQYKTNSETVQTVSQQKKYNNIMAEALGFAIKKDIGDCIPTLLDEITSLNITEDIYLALENMEQALKSQILKKGKLSVNAQFLDNLRKGEDEAKLLNRVSHLQTPQPEFAKALFRVSQTRPSGSLFKSLSKKYPLHYVKYLIDHQQDRQIIAEAINATESNYDISMVYVLAEQALITQDDELLNVLSNKFPSEIKYATHEILDTYENRIFENDTSLYRNVKFMVQHTASIPDSKKAVLIGGHYLFAAKDKGLWETMIEAGYGNVLTKRHLLNLINKQPGLLWFKAMLNKMDEENIIKALPSLSGRHTDNTTRIKLLNMAKQHPNVLSYMLNNHYLDGLSAQQLSVLPKELISNEAFYMNQKFINKAAKNEGVFNLLLNSNLPAKSHNALIAFHILAKDAPINIDLITKLKTPVADSVKKNLHLAAIKKIDLDAFKYLDKHLTLGKELRANFARILKKDPKYKELERHITKPIAASNKENIGPTSITTKLDESAKLTNKRQKKLNS